MMRAVSWLATQIIVAFAVFVASGFFAAVAGFLQLLPTLAPFVVRAIWTVLVLSCRLDYILLSALAPFVERHTRIRILEGPLRLVSTLSLSFVICCVLMWLLQWQLNGWALLVILLHGVFVGLVWNEIFPQGQIHVGTRVKWDR